MISRTLIAAVAAGSVAFGPAHSLAAPPTQELAGWLDPDAAIVLKLDPAQIENVGEVAGAAGGKLAAAVDVVSMISQGAVGFDVTRAAAWTDAGFDGPFLVQVTAIDATAADKIYKTLGAARSWTAKTYRSLTMTYFRGRIAIPVSDFGRAKATLSKIRLLPQLYPVNSDSAADIATVLGAASPKSLKGLVRWLRGRGVFLVGRVDGLDATVFARRASSDLIIIDVLASYAGGPVVWHRDKKELDALLVRGGKSGLAKRLASGGGKQLSESGSAIWMSPVELWDVATALGRREILRALADGELPPRPTEARICKSFGEIAHSGAFEDVALRWDVGDREIAIAAAWGLRTRYALDTALATEDDRLPSPGPRAELSAAAVLYLAGTQKLRAMARPDAMSSWDELWSRIDRCGDRASILVGVFGWPQVAGLFLDELAGLDPSARAAVDGIGNAAVAVSKLSWSANSAVGAGEVAFDPAGAGAVQSYARAVFGQRKRHKQPRAHSTWGRGAIRPYAYSDGAAHIMGAAFGGAKVAWRLGHAGAQRKKSPPLARLDANIERALADLGAPDLGRALAARYGKTMRAVVVTSDGILAATAWVRKK